MKLKKFTDTQAVKHLIRKKQASWEHRRKTGEKHHVLAYLYPDNRFTNAKIWLELPQAAVDKALAKQEKLGFHTDDLPTLDQAIASYRLGKATEAQLVRFYYDGTDPDQKPPPLVCRVCRERQHLPVQRRPHPGPGIRRRPSQGN